MSSSWMQRLRLIISRGVVTQVEETKKLRTLQVSALDGEVLGEVEHFEGYGLTARPVLGAESLLASVLGIRSHSISPATPDRRYRPRGVLAEGDVALYTQSDSPAAAHASAAHRIALVANGKKIVARCDEFDLKTAGGAQVIGNASALSLKFGSMEIKIEASQITIGGKVWATHTHTGVQSGGSNTGGVTP